MARGDGAHVLCPAHRDRHGVTDDYIRLQYWPATLGRAGVAQKTLPAPGLLLGSLWGASLEMLLDCKVRFGMM
jgi:hypothetical protein